MSDKKNHDNNSSDSDDDDDDNNNEGFFLHRDVHNIEYEQQEFNQPDDNNHAPAANDDDDHAVPASPENSLAAMNRRRARVRRKKEAEHLDELQDQNDKLKVDNQRLKDENKLLKEQRSNVISTLTHLASTATFSVPPDVSALPQSLLQQDLPPPQQGRQHHDIPGQDHDDLRQKDEEQHYDELIKGYQQYICQLMQENSMLTTRCNDLLSIMVQLVNMLIGIVNITTSGAAPNAKINHYNLR